MAQLNTQQLAVGAAVTGIVTLGGLAWWWERKKKAPKQKGKVRCPTRPLVDVKDVRLGDYVVVDLAAKNDSFHEYTWGRVSGATPSGKLQVKLIGETGEGGKPKAINTAKHGFVLNQILLLFPSCILEIYRPVPKQGHILCAAELPDVDPEVDAALLEIGDYAQVFVVDREGNSERVWTQVSGVGPEQQVVKATVFGEPTNANQHGYHRGDYVTFLRDCVVDVSLGKPPVESEGG